MRPTILVALLAAAAVTFPAGVAAGQDASERMDDGDWHPCGRPIVAEARQLLPVGQEPVPRCPCFGPTDLAQLPAIAPDLCVDSGLTIQITRWFGPTDENGREGFNVVASLPSPRTAGGSCMFLRRSRHGGAREQSYRRNVDLPANSATACHELVDAWLESRGGCQFDIPPGR